MLTKVVESDHLDPHPLKPVKQLKERNQRLRYLSAEELGRLLEVSSPYLHVVIIVGVGTCMRKGELLRLRCVEITFASGFVSVNPQSKNGHRRELPMNAAVREALQGLTRGTPLQRVLPRGFRESFDTAVRRAGISEFRCYDLRHTSTSYLVMDGVDIRTVQEMLGHRTLAMTMRYTHLSPGHSGTANRVRAVMVLPPRRYPSHASFDVVIVCALIRRIDPPGEKPGRRLFLDSTYVYGWVLEKPAQPRPKIQRVPYCLTKSRAGKYPLGKHPLAYIFHYRRRLLAPKLCQVRKLLGTISLPFSAQFQHSLWTKSRGAHHQFHSGN